VHVAFRVDPENPLTYAAQVQRQTLAQLIAGRLRPGDRFPSVRRLARDLGISRTTGEKIQNQLCHATLAEVRPRSGVFVASPDDATQRERLSHVRAIYELLKDTVLRARDLGLESRQLAELICEFEDHGRGATRLACFPVIATQDWYECMLASLGSDFPGRLAHLSPQANPAQFPPDARYVLSGYYMRGRGRQLAAAVGRPLIYIRYNVRLLDRAIASSDRRFRYVVTRDPDNADSTRQFLASAYPEVPANRYAVMPVREFLDVAARQHDLRDPVWATVTAVPFLKDRVPPAQLEILHPLLADDFIEELCSLALIS
jgi:DNA-binding transcriptional regulator YhcF (GntR family)